MMDDGKVIGCALTPRTIAERIQSRTNDIPEGEEKMKIIRQSAKL